MPSHRELAGAALTQLRAAGIDPITPEMIARLVDGAELVRADAVGIAAEAARLGAPTLVMKHWSRAALDVEQPACTAGTVRKSRSATWSSPRRRAAEGRGQPAPLSEPRAGRPEVSRRVRDVRDDDRPPRPL
jgi:hypothetical protein